MALIIFNLEVVHESAIYNIDFRAAVISEKGLKY
jgi:hypothetical protein